MEYATNTLLFVAAIWAIISAAGALPIIMLAKMDLKLVDDDKARRLLRLVLTHKNMTPNWIGTHGFSPLGVFEITGTIGSPYVVAWQRAREKTYLCIYVIQQQTKGIDFVTVFEHGGLTTANTKDTHAAPPRPDRWVQSFQCDIARQWEHHAAALDFLKQAIGATPSRQETDFRDAFVGNVRAHAKYVRSLPLWFLRMPYWYFVRRNLRHNKPVREQFERNPIGPQRFSAQ
jgi:hypothetical protein